MGYYHFPTKPYKSLSETSRSTTSSPRSDIRRPKKRILNIVYIDIDEDLLTKAAIKTKGVCGPSGLDADNWRRMLVSNQFGSSPLEFRTFMASFVKRLGNARIHLSNSDTENSLETFTVSRLVPLNKNPGVRPIDVGEVLRRIAGKVVMYIAKKEESKLRN